MKKNTVLDLLFIFLLGLIPLLWFPGSTVILGHDSGLPLDPFVHFVDRLYVWSQRFGIGTDQSYALLGAFFIHGLEAFLSFIGFSMQLEQKVQFVFWFTFPGIAMYFLVHKIWPERRYMALTAAMVYMLNYYLIQAWFIAERTKFSIYIALPFVMYFLIFYLTKRIGFWQSIIFSGLTLGVFNGGGSFPLYGGLIVAILTSYAYINFIYHDLETLKRTILFSLGVAVLYFLLNSYWLITYYYYVVSFYGRDLANAGGADGVLTWVKYLSKGSTLMNLMRGQGIPEWYLNDFHPYSKIVTGNFLFKIVSFGFPLLAFFPLIVIKTKKEKFYFYLLFLIAFAGILLSAGTNSQFGFIFELFVRHIPGFAMFRSAYYKFDYAVWFSFAILIGFSVDYLIAKINENKFRIGKVGLQSFVFALFVVVYIFYHYPVLNGMFFDFNGDPKGKISTRINVPDYVFEFGKWANTQDPNKRYLVVPELNDSGYISYEWGFWSLAPVSSLLSKNSFVQNTGLMPASENLLLKQMYKSLLDKDFDSFMDFADIFAVDSIMVQDDYNWKSQSWGTTDPAEYEKILEGSPRFKLEKVFGKWKVYKIVEREKSLRISASHAMDFLQGDLGNIVSFPYFNPSNPLYIAGNQDDSFYANAATALLVGSPCVGCDLRDEDHGFVVYNPKLLPGSLLYNFAITKNENVVKKSANDFKSRVNYYMTTADRRSIEIKWMVEFRQNLDYLPQTIQRYEQSLKDLKSELSQDEWGIDSLESEELARTVTGHMLTEASLIASVHNEDVFTSQNKVVLASSYELLNGIIDLIKDKNWVTENATEKKYIFTLPITGSYEVFVKRGSLAHPESNISGTGVVIKETGSILNPQGQVEDWISFGKADLSSKILHISFKDTTVNNLVENVSGVFSSNSGILKTANSYTMTADSANKCLSFPVSKLKVGEENKYIISFNYRNFTQNKTLSFSIDNKIRHEASLRTKETLLPSKQNWTLFKASVSPAESTSALNFCNGFTSVNDLQGQAPWLNYEETNQGAFIPQEILDSDSSFAVTEIKDVAFYKVSEPNIVLYKTNAKDVFGDINAEFVKKNPVEYDVTLEKTTKPTFVTMRESFGKYWQVCDENKKCLPIETKLHFADAGFANTWYFENGVGPKLNFYYYPQRTFLIGAVISLVGYLGIVIWIIYLFLIKNKRNRK